MVYLFFSNHNIQMSFSKISQSFKLRKMSDMVILSPPSECNDNESMHIFEILVEILVEILKTLGNSKRFVTTKA